MVPTRQPRERRETVELTEMLVLHGESLGGVDREKQSKLERIKEAMRRNGVDFVDQPDALEIWMGTANMEVVITTLEELGYQVDLYEI